MIKRDYSNKNITFYAITKKDDPDENILTIVPSVADAREYIQRMLQVDHFDHFRSWAELKKLDINAPQTWYLYSAMCVEDAEWDNYLIAKLRYKNRDIAALLRIFAHTVPLGCSYENPIELQKFKAQLEIKNSIMEAWNKSKKDSELNKIIEDAKNKVEKEFADMAEDEVDEDGDE